MKINSIFGGVIALALGCLLALGASAQNATEFSRMPVIDILNNPPAAGTKVETYGTVVRNVRAQTGRASTYLLGGDEGGELEVQGDAPSPPIPNTRFARLRGIVQYKVGTGGQPMPYLMEIPAPPIINPPPPSLLEKYLPHLLMLGGVVVLGVFVLLFLKMRQPSPEAAYAATMPESASAAPGGAAVEMVSDADDEITIRRDQTTVRLSEVTRVFFPGHLVIKSGGEAGKKIPLCSSAEGGPRVTIGRRSSAGGGGAFIGLDDPSRALSRNQAVVVYDKVAGHILLENQQASNPTTIDGRPLGAGETVTLKPGMVIGFPPEFSFEFQAGPAYAE